MAPSSLVHWRSRTKKRILVLLRHGFSGGRAALGFAAFAFALLLLVDGEQFGVFGGLGLLLDLARLLDGEQMTLTLQTLRGDETLDLGCLGLLLLALFALLGLEWPTNDIFAHIVLFAQVEQLANLVSTLRSTHAWYNTVVRPSISSSPFLTMTSESTLRLLSTMQPLTDLRRRSPERRSR